MVGDMSVDIDAGKNAGAKTIAVLCGFLTPARIEEYHIQPDFVFQNVAEMVQHLPTILTKF